MTKHEHKRNLILFRNRVVKKLERWMVCTALDKTEPEEDKQALKLIFEYALAELEFLRVVDDTDSATTANDVTVPTTQE